MRDEHGRKHNSNYESLYYNNALTHYKEDRRQLLKTCTVRLLAPPDYVGETVSIGFHLTVINMRLASSLKL